MTRPAAELLVDFGAGNENLTTRTPPLTRDGITIARGNTSLVTTGFVAGEGKLDTNLDNIDRQFDPNYTAGPRFGALPPSPITVGRVQWGGATDLFFGYGEGFPQQFPLDGADQAVAFSAKDGNRKIANAQVTLRRTSEYSGARIEAILAHIGYVGASSIAHGNCIVGPLQHSTISAWSHLTDVANAEWGDLYFAKDGTIVFRSRDQILSDTRSTVSQATYVQDPADGLAFSGVAMGSPPRIDDCSIVHNDRGHEVNWRDQTAIDTLGDGVPSSLNLSLPIQSASQARQYAKWIVQRYAYPIYTFQSLTFTPANEPGDTFDLWADLFARELSDLVTVTLDPLGADLDDDGKRLPSGEPITRDCWIRGLTFNFQQEPFSVQMFLQDASWRTGLFRWDVSEWDGPDVWGM